MGRREILELVSQFSGSVKELRHDMTLTWNQCAFFCRPRFVVKAFDSQFQVDLEEL